MASDAKDWGETDSTGIRWEGDVRGGFDARKLSTSTFDCIVMSTDSADVIHPL